MNQLLSIYKPIGLTPLQLIHALRTEKPEYTDETIGYAGRLDPMAHGVMLLMVGEETKNRERYLSLPKTYSFQVLFGVETDTYDVLGLLKDKNVIPIPSNVNAIVNSFVNNKFGTQIQSYPPFSSKTVHGKPLFQWAKEGKLNEIEIPHHEITIQTFRVTASDTINPQSLEKLIFTNLTHIQGDFRQNEIIKCWKDFFSENSNRVYRTTTFEISCSSGTYVRQLVHELGNEIGCGAVTLAILRTQIGNYRLTDALHLSSLD